MDPAVKALPHFCIANTTPGSLHGGLRATSPVPCAEPSVWSAKALNFIYPPFSLTWQEAPCGQRTGRKPSSGAGSSLTCWGAQGWTMSSRQRALLTQGAGQVPWGAGQVPRGAGRWEGGPGAAVINGLAATEEEKVQLQLWQCVAPGQPEPTFGYP